MLATMERHYIWRATSQASQMQMEMYIYYAAAAASAK